MVILITVSFPVVGIAPLGQTEGSQKDIGGTRPFIPTVQNICTVLGIHLVFKTAVYFAAIHIAGHILMILRIPECILVVRIDNGRVGSYIVFHQQVYIIIIDTGVKITQEFTRNRISTCIQKLTGHIGADPLPRALVKIDTVNAVIQHNPIQGESAVIKRGVRRARQTVLRPSTVTSGIAYTSFSVIGSAVRIQPLLHMELHPVVGVDHIAKGISLFLGCDLACVQNQSIVINHLGILNGRSLSRISLPGIRRILLIGEVFIAVGIELNKRIFILNSAAAAASTAWQAAKGNISSVLRCCRGHKFPCVRCTTLSNGNPSVEANRYAIHRETHAAMRIFPPILLPLRGLDLDGRGIIDLQRFTSFICAVVYSS